MPYRVRGIHKAVMDHGDEALIHCPAVSAVSFLEEDLPEKGEGNQGVAEEDGQTQQRHHQQRLPCVEKQKI